MTSNGGRSMICLCRSWRTATWCSCLQPPRLVLALSILYIILHSSQSQAKYSQDAGIVYYTTSCNTSWCGLNWDPNRILRYTYNVTHKLVVEHYNHVEHVNNCSGAQDSANCKSRTVEKNETTPRRVTETVRSSTPNITRLPASSLYLITTDNINDSSSISDTYPLNQDKIWQIHIPKRCKMSVYFSVFDLQVTEASDRCKQDSFTVQTSKYQQDIRKYCNNLHWIKLKRIRRVQMTFHSDHAVTRGGIKAVACLSNLHDPSSETELSQQLPCTCDPSVQRRKKDSRSYKFLKHKIAAENEKVSKWLHQLMEGGQEVVEDILRDPDSPKQRHLAELYQEVLSKHRDW